MRGTPKYLHEVVLFIDVSKDAAGDGPRDDRLRVRGKRPEQTIARYLFIPGQDSVPRPDPLTSGADTFFAEIQRLANHMPSRLTILAHGLPGVIAAYPKNGYPGYTGEMMAGMLRGWGLRAVSRISILACHGAVNKKLYLSDDEMKGATEEAKKANLELRDKPHFQFAAAVTGRDFFNPWNAGLSKPSHTKELNDEVARLRGSFAQRFHAALADPTLPNQPVRAEVTARVMRTKTSASGRNHVELPFRVLEHRGELDAPLTHRAPGSKFVFYWEGIRQAVRAEHYPPAADAADGPSDNNNNNNNTTTHGSGVLSCPIGDPSTPEPDPYDSEEEERKAMEFRQQFGEDFGGDSGSD